MPRVLIDQRALTAIKGHALKAWQERKSWNGFDEREVQQATIIAGLASYLRQNGVEPGFEFPPEREDLYNPIEEEWTPMKDPKK